ncbi:MAG: phage tail tape measure protein, partial [Nitrospiraceae bacterium]
LAIMNPIMNAMVPGSNLPAFFDFGAKGMAFSGGVKKMAKGDILNGPTLFKHQSGMAVGGEAGTEAVMPLTRDGSGNLGVRAVGNTDSGNIQVNIFNRAPTKVKAREERRGGQRSLILEIDEINAGLIASGNSRTSSVLGRRGAPPQRNLRS